MPEKTRLLLRWGVWVCYSEWRPDQPHEDWSGRLAAEGGRLHNPQLVMYHGHWGAQHRTYISLPAPEWRSPLIEFPRPVYGYKGLEGLLVEVEGDAATRLAFRTKMLNVDFRLGDIPAGGQLHWHTGPKYSCSELVVCRLEDEGCYWNDASLAEASRRDGRRRLALGLEKFCGTFLARELHHRIGAWIPPGASVRLPFRWESDRPAVVTWRFAGAHWTLGLGGDEKRNPTIEFETALDGRSLGSGRFVAKYMRGAQSALEHSDQLGRLDPGREHELAITNRSALKAYLVLYPPTLQEEPADWSAIREHLPFQAEWFDGVLPAEDAVAADLPSGGRGLALGYDTNMMAAENGWIDAAIRYLGRTRGGNYILFRTEGDAVSAEDWRRWFELCRAQRVYFAINTSIGHPALPIPKLLELARDTGGEYFVGMKQHELSIPLYAGWRPTNFPPTKTLAEAEADYLAHVRKHYAQCPPGVNRLLGEAMLAHRYAYKAGVDLILSETMTGNTSLLLAEARGAARAYGRSRWGLHIACHVHCSPEGWHQERMFPLNLFLGYLSGASIIEDEEGGLAKVHSFVSGPSDPLPAARQAAIAAFHRWALAHPRRAEPEVALGFLYGRHEAITGGMSLNTARPVRVWEEFGPAAPEWEYGKPEYGWLLLDTCLSGVWLCPVLQPEARLRRWFAGTPHGPLDVVPIEMDAEKMAAYKLLVCPGWNTMTGEDLARLTRYVESGGTLVLGLAQLQDSADRTRVLASRQWTFGDPAALERLCGLRIRGPGRRPDSVTALGKTWPLADAKDGPVLFADLELTGGRPALADGDLPLVVEHALGRGRIYTFTAWEHFGHRGLLPLVRAWLEQFLATFPFPVRLEGGAGEVAWFVYPEKGGRRVFLVNTDWTTAGNVKQCRLHCGGAVAEVAVREGQVAEVFLPEK